jgi:hypothetical protein
MVKAKFVVYYYELDDECELRKTLRNYITLFSPDVDALTDALLLASYSNPKVTVVKTPDAIYIAPGEYRMDNAEKSYEFLVGKEAGLRRVTEEILGVESRWNVNTLANILQGILWGTALILGYLGYKNDAFNEVSSYMMLVLVTSWLLENFRKGYKKREGVRASAPRHSSE